MSILNWLLRGLFDVVLFPFQQLPALVGLAVVSLLTAIAMLLVFKATSDQDRIQAVKRRIHAGLFEIRLFNDDLRAILRAQMGILRHNFTYIRLSLVPMLWMIIPLVLVMAQLQFFYGYSGLQPGDVSLLKVVLQEDWEQHTADPVQAGSRRPALSLKLPAGLKQETPAVWLPPLREMVWRISAVEWGDYEITIQAGEETLTKSLEVSQDVLRRSPVRLAPGFVNQLLYPAEDPLPAQSLIQSVALIYPPGDIPVLGWEIHWMIVFFVLSIVFAFALRNRLNVKI